MEESAGREVESTAGLTDQTWDQEYTQAVRGGSTRPVCQVNTLLGSGSGKGWGEGAGAGARADTAPASSAEIGARRAALQAVRCCMLTDS